MPSIDELTQQYQPTAQQSNAPVSIDDLVAKYSPPAAQGAMAQAQAKLQKPNENILSQEFDQATNAGANFLRPLVGQPQVNNEPDLDAIRAAASAAHQPGEGFIDRVASGAKGAYENTNWKQKLGAVEESLMDTAPGYLAQAAGGTTMNIPTAIMGAASQAAEKMGIPHQVSNALMMAAPLAAKSILPEAPPTEAQGAAPPVDVPPAMQNVANILLSKGDQTPDSILEAAGKGIDADVPTTLPEATGNANLLNRQRVIGEQANEGGQQFQDFNQARMQNEVPQAKEDLINTQKGTATTLTNAGESLRQSAQQMIADAVQQRTESVRPLYDQIKNKPIASDDLMALRSNPTIENEYQRVLGNDSLMERVNVPNPQTGDLEPKGGLAPDSIAALDVVKKNLNGDLQRYLEKDPGSKMVPILTQSMQQVRDTLNATDPTYGKANDEYASASPEIQAMKDSGIGRLAMAKTGENAAKTLMNMSREQLADVLPKLQQVNPKGVQDMAASWLRQVTDQVSGKGLNAYIKQFSGDNKIVADKMQLLLGDDAYEGQQALIDTFKKIQSGQPRNSETASKTATLNTMNDEASGVHDTIDIASKFPLNEWQAVNHVLSWIKAQKLIGGAKNQADLMKIFLNPDLEQLGQALKNTADPTPVSTKVLNYLASHLPDTTETGRSGVAPSAAAGGAAALIGNQAPPATALDQAKQKLMKATPTINPPAQTPQVNNAAPDVTKFAAAESSNNPNAKNPNSSASGMYQFTNKTWADMVKKYGQETGITLGDKANPQAQATMAQKYAQDNITSLNKTLGRMPSKEELYMAHVLGAHGAATLINAPGDREAILLFPKQVLDSNRSIFFNGKQPRTVSEVYNLLSKKVA